MPLRVGEVVVTGLPPTDAFPGELFKFLMEGNGGELALHAHDLHPLAVGFQLLHLGIDIALVSGGHKTRSRTVCRTDMNGVSVEHKARPCDFGGGLPLGPWHSDFRVGL